MVPMLGPLIPMSMPATEGAHESLRGPRHGVASRAILRLSLCRLLLGQAFNCVNSELRVFFAMRIGFRVAGRGKRSLRPIEVLEREHHNAFWRLTPNRYGFATA